MLGEYGTSSGVPGSSVMDKLAAIVDYQNVSDDVKGFLIVALTKLACQTGTFLTQQAQEVVHDAVNSRNIELQQRALEQQALLR